VSQAPHLPPTPRRRALARQAGLVPLSGRLVGAAAWAGAAAAVAWAGAAGARALAGQAADGVSAAAAAADPTGAALAAVDGVVGAALAVAAPAVLAAAALAIAAHAAQTRGLWLPRRTIRGAPQPRATAARRAADGAIGLVAAAAVGAVVVRLGWRYGGDLVHAGASARGLALVAVALAQIAAVLVAVGVVDWLVRVRAHAVDLSMTAQERRDDDRASAADPRWRRARRERAAEGAAADVAAAAVVVVGDQVAAAIRWHARWHPVPRVAVAGRERIALSLVAAARRAGVPIQRDPVLAGELARLAAGAPVPTALHGRLARHLAAVGSGTG